MAEITNDNLAQSDNQPLLDVHWIVKVWRVTEYSQYSNCYLYLLQIQIHWYIHTKKTCSVRIPQWS